MEGDATCGEMDAELVRLGAQRVQQAQDAGIFRDDVNPVHVVTMFSSWSARSGSKPRKPIMVTGRGSETTRSFLMISCNLHERPAASSKFLLTTPGFSAHEKLQTQKPITAQLNN